MLKIIEIGKFRCDVCKDGKKKKGVELQSYGYATEGSGEFDESEPPPARGERLPKKINIRLYVWREQLHLCLEHLKEYVEHMIDDPFAGLWEIHKQAAMRKDYVNITFEEADKKGLI